MSIILTVDYVPHAGERVPVTMDGEVVGTAKNFRKELLNGSSIKGNKLCADVQLNVESSKKLKDFITCGVPISISPRIMAQTPAFSEAKIEKV